MAHDHLGLYNDVIHCQKCNAMVSYYAVTHTHNIIIMVPVHEQVFPLHAFYPDSECKLKQGNCGRQCIKTVITLQKQKG